MQQANNIQVINNCNVVSDIPGRLRIRLGRHSMLRGQDGALEEFLMQSQGIISAKVNYSTGSVLVFYNDSCTKADIIERIVSINVRSLSPVVAERKRSEIWSIIDAPLRKQLLKMLAIKLMTRYLLPSPVRMVLNSFKSLRFFARAIACLRQRHLTVEVLDAAAIGASMSQGNFDSASTIMFLLSVSDVMQDYTLKKTKSILVDSLRTNISNVWVLDGEVERSIPMSELKVGDTVVVRTGAAIPVDGVVRGGEALVNESTMTGESMATFKKDGDSVFAGTTLEDGKLQIEVRLLESDTRISQIVDLIEESENLKASVQGKAERLADKLVPYNFLLTLAVFAITRDITKALSVLLVDFSCAIKLATPIAVLSAMSEASNLGMVVKGGKYLEAMSEADTIVFDKTGTLTKAEPNVCKVVPLGEYTREYVLRFSACMEEHFPHSVAKAIVRAAKEEGLNHEEEHAEVVYIAAHGIVTTINGQRAVIGSKHFLFEDEGVELSEEHHKMIDSEDESVICLAIDYKLVGYITIDDPLREEAISAIKGLRQVGFKNLIMLTGDGEASAKKTSELLGLDGYHAKLLPEDKVSIIDRLKSEGKKVVMVGDGINDSPALARADVSIAMNDASDLAKEVADITMKRSDLEQLISVRNLSVGLMKRIHNNYRVIIGFNSGVLLGGLTSVLTPASSAMLHNLSTMTITASSMRHFLKTDTHEFEKISYEENKI